MPHAPWHRIGAKCQRHYLGPRPDRRKDHSRATYIGAAPTAKTRLENLLQGVAGTQKQSKTVDIAASIGNIEAASLTGGGAQRTAEYAETYLQSPVTAIPLSILTSLPGSSTYNISTQ